MLERLRPLTLSRLTVPPVDVDPHGVSVCSVHASYYVDFSEHTSVAQQDIGTGQ